VVWSKQRMILAWMTMLIDWLSVVFEQIKLIDYR
jgi:hypothetical protein